MLRQTVALLFSLGMVSSTLLACGSRQRRCTDGGRDVQGGIPVEGPPLVIAGVQLGASMASASTWCAAADGTWDNTLSVDDGPSTLCTFAPDKAPIANLSEWRVGGDPFERIGSITLRITGDNAEAALSDLIEQINAGQDIRSTELMPTTQGELYLDWNHLRGYIKLRGTYVKGHLHATVSFYSEHWEVKTTYGLPSCA